MGITSQSRSERASETISATHGGDDQGIESASVRASRPANLARRAALHWLTAFCVAVAATLILVRDEVDGRSWRLWLLEGHRHFGLFVLILFAVRVSFRLLEGRQASEHAMPKIMRVLAGLTHLALYALLLALPLLGWSLSSAQGKPVHLFGLTLPALVGEDEDLADRLQAWHIDAAWLLLALVSLHVLAALWHHFVRHDDVLRRMLPRRGRR